MTVSGLFCSVGRMHMVSGVNPAFSEVEKSTRRGGNRQSKLTILRKVAGLTLRLKTALWPSSRAIDTGSCWQTSRDVPMQHHGDICTLTFVLEGLGWALQPQHGGWSHKVYSFGQWARAYHHPYVT